MDLVRNDPERGEKAVPHGEDGITPDAAMIVLANVNKGRDKLDKQKKSYDLRELVKWYCDRLPFAEVEKRYGYELVLMRYYTLLSQFKAERLRKRREHLKEREQTLSKNLLPLA
ncbi:MAG: hypothetical protein AAB472_02475 [Patescibacteria group bacterium]